MANADTGTTGHYIAMKDMNCLANVKPCKPHESITVIMPTGAEIKSTFTGELNYPHITSGKKVHVFESLWGSLLGIGDLCDTGLIAIFDKEAVYIVDVDRNEVVLTGIRDEKTRLWMIAMQPISHHDEKSAIKAANIAYEKSASVGGSYISAQEFHSVHDEGDVEQSENDPRDLASFANAASTQKLDTAGDRVEFFSRVFCSAAESTLINAVTKSWIKFPGITAQTLKRHRHRMRTHESAAGHLDQVHQNHKPHVHQQPKIEASDDMLKPINVITHVYSEYNHMDATGRFPAVSHRGHQYLLIMYSEGGNYIKAIPMKDRNKTSYLPAHQDGVDFFTRRGYRPTFQRLDNETSTDLFQHLAKNHINIDLAPPYQHRRNKAERAIRTYKNHLIAAIAGVDPSFPMCAWSELLEHIEITLNMLRPSPSHPRLSAWEGMNGAYDFDAHPLAPPGTAVTIHEKPEQRDSWSKHGIEGFYLGPASNHYRCYKVWATHTSSIRVTDTLAWHPHGYNWEEYSPLDMVTETADVLAKALHHLATSDTTTAAQRQPIQAIAHELTANFKALQHVYDPPVASEQDTTSVSSPAPTQRVSTAAPVDCPGEQRVPAEQEVPPPVHQTAVPPGPTAESEPTCAPTPIDTSETPAAGAPACNRRQSKRRKHKFLNRANAASYKATLANLNYYQRQALMIFERSRGLKPKVRNKDKRPTMPTEASYKHAVNQAVRDCSRMNTRRSAWADWEKLPGVQLDSTGTPFFTHITDPDTRLFANTAVDLDAAGKKLSMTTALASEEGHIWLQKHGEEITRLFESETIKLIYWNQLPAGKKAAYYNPQVRTKIKDGELQYRVRGTIGGDQIHYNGDTAAHTASMQLIKIHLNAVVSDPNAKYMTADIKDFYLGTPLPNTEYMRINLQHIPQDVIDKHNMTMYAVNGAVVVEVHKGIYGLPQAGILAQDRLVKHLATHGYHQAANTPCLFKHASNSVSFTLVVDDFGIKYTHDEDADHLMKALREMYIMTEDRAAKQKYVGITIEHDRVNHVIYLSMPGYVEKAIIRFGKPNKSGANSPIHYTPPAYGREQQMTQDLPPEAYEYVDAKTKTFVQEVTGVFLFYSRAVDPTMLTAVNRISSEQSKPTKATLLAVDRLLSYAERHPVSRIALRPSNMQLCAQSDASYNSESGARSRAGGILHFGLNSDGSINGAIDYISCIIPTVCSASAESEYAALFLIGREATSARHILHDLGYTQGATIIICDNTCAVGIANDNVKQKRSKAIDMRYHWIRDQVSQGKFKVIWEKGSTNLADYFTKVHPVHHVVNIRRLYVCTTTPTVIRECARSRQIERRNIKAR